MDILLLENIVPELQRQLGGSSIAKVHQPTADTLVLRLWTGRDNPRLLLSVGSHARLHLTEASYPNPFTPPRFCQLLRSRLSRLDTFTLIEGERIVCLECAGPEGRFKLYAELFGLHGNLLLVDEQGMIIDTLVRKKEDRDGRQLLPGKPYKLPQPQQRLSLRLQVPELPPEQTPPEKFSRWLQRNLNPMSPAQAQSLAWEVGQGLDPASLLENFRQALLCDGLQPGLVDIDGEPLLVAWPPETAPRLSEDRSLSQLLDDLFYPLQFEAGKLGDRGELQRVLSRERKRLVKRIENIGREGQAKESFDDRRQLGDLLLANLYQVKKGMTSVTVSDYNREPPAEVIIPLDPKLSPQDNAQALFKRYKKDKRGVEHIERRTAETEEELAWIDQVQLCLDEAETPGDLHEVAAELKQAGLYQQRHSEPTTRRKLTGTPNLRQITSPSGFTILWGRNNRANDYLTTRVAAAHDYWFHAQGIPGCHLVLKRDSSQVEVSEDDLEFAARLAAGYSRARNDHKVEVICCQARDVYKVKGAHPGQVNLRQFDSLRVEPLRLDEEAPNE